MYPELMVAPMRQELTQLGLEELCTVGEVDAFVQRPGTSMVVVNSICGCAAGRMRPAIRLALGHSVRPDHIGTVFAGQDREATEQARRYFIGFAPSSPCIALMCDGKVIHMLQRSDLEHREAQDIAGELTRAFDKFCAQPGISA